VCERPLRRPDWQHRPLLPLTRFWCAPQPSGGIERQLDHHPPDAVLRLSLTDDVFLRSYNWARVQLGIPLPVE
jgi:hypothetical protein